MAPAFSKFAVSVSFGVAGDSCSGLSVGSTMVHSGATGQSEVAGVVGAVAGTVLPLAEILAENKKLEPNTWIVGEKSNTELEATKGPLTELIAEEQLKEALATSPTKKEAFEALVGSTGSLLETLGSGNRKVLKDVLHQSFKDLEKTNQPVSWDDRTLGEALAKAKESLEAFAEGLREFLLDDQKQEDGGRQLNAKMNCSVTHNNVFSTIASYICYWWRYPGGTAIAHAVVLVLIVALSMWCCCGADIARSCRNLRGDAQNQCTIAGRGVAVACQHGGEAVAGRFRCIAGGCRRVCASCNKCCWKAGAEEAKVEETGKGGVEADIENQEDLKVAIEDVKVVHVDVHADAAIQ